jgi:predicted DNA-binding transcriptional regulator YafY
MRADRLLSILLLLQTHQRLTGRDLAKRLEVSERTIHRDMEALGMAGVPVSAERGTGGGWSLLEGYRTQLTGLNTAEIQALLLPRPARLLSDLGLQQAADAALLKLLAALPAVSRSNAEYARQRLHVDGAGWHEATEAVPHLLPIQEAIWQERKLLLSYQRGDGAQVERLTDPLGLVAKGGVWYLVAAVDSELRSYRVSRVQNVQITEEPFMRPEGFDLAAYWQQSTADFKAHLPRYPATLRADPAIVSAMRSADRYARVEEVSLPDSDGWVTVCMLFEEEHNACEYVLRFGRRVQVVEPASLRAAVIQEAESIVALYAEDDQSAG